MKEYKLIVNFNKVSRQVNLVKIILSLTQISLVQSYWKWSNNKWILRTSDLQLFPDVSFLRPSAWYSSPVDTEHITAYQTLPKKKNYCSTLIYQQTQITFHLIQLYLFTFNIKKIICCRERTLKCFQKWHISSMDEEVVLYMCIAYRKATAYGCRFFCFVCFQFRSTRTGTLLLIRRPRRVTGWVDHRHLHTRTHIVAQDVRTLRQWSSLPKAGTLWCSYRHESDLKSAFKPTHKSVRQPHSTIVLQGEASVLSQRQKQTNCEVWQSIEGFFTLTHTTGFELASKR